MAVLVGEDVRLGERTALGAELRLQLVEEAEVDIDVAVVRAVKERAQLQADAPPQPVWIDPSKRRVAVGE